MNNKHLKTTTFENLPGFRNRVNAIKENKSFTDFFYNKKYNDKSHLVC